MPPACSLILAAGSTMYDRIRLCRRALSFSNTKEPSHATTKLVLQKKKKKMKYVILQTRRYELAKNESNCYGIVPD